MKNIYVIAIVALVFGQAARGDETTETMAPPSVQSAIQKALMQTSGGSDETAEQGDQSVTEQINSYIEDQTSKGLINKEQGNWRTRLPKFPDVAFDDGKTYFWVLDTNKGQIKVKLLTETAPNHAANFIYLTELGFFDDLIFHRVIKGFMAQGGCPLGSGTGSPGYRFDGEYDPSVKHDKPGLLSMANAGPGTDGSQFFLTFAATPWLDGRHTIFGDVVEGMDVVQALEAVGSPDGSGRTSERLTMDKAVIAVE